MPATLSERSHRQKNKRVAYLWGANVFPGISDTASLNATNAVDSLVPGRLDKVLQLQNAWGTPRKLFMALSSGALDVRNEHLNIPVSAESTFFGSFTDMDGRWVAVISFSDATIQSGQLSEDRDDAGCFVLHLLLFDESPVPANAVDSGDLRTSSKLIMQPLRHTTLPGVGTELGSLVAVSKCAHTICGVNLHPNEHF